MYRLKALLISFFIFCFGILSSYSQSGKIIGKITTYDGKKNKNIEVSIPSINIKTTANEKGEFYIYNLEAKTYELYFYSDGYFHYSKKIAIKENEETHVDIILEDTTELKGVIIKAKENITLKPIRAQVLETEKIYEQSSTLAELINRSTGVRIRESGGLGARPDVSINGLRDKSVRYFRDGIPSNYLGAGYSLGIVPSNALDKIVVYKGVMPVQLGNDALAGGIDLISRNSRHNYLSASYEISSFNTHRASINGNWTNRENTFFIGTNSFINYSDNSYEANVRAIDNETKKPYDAKVRLFHNGIKNNFIEFFAGISNMAFVDELKLTLTYFNIEDQVQNDPKMLTPYGAVLRKQNAIVPSLRYKKTLLNDKIGIDQFIAYNKLEAHRIDTLSHKKYDWFGNILDFGVEGETGTKALSHFNFTHFNSRTNLYYQFIENHKLELNSLISNTQRIGEDKYGRKLNNSDIQIVSIPSTYNKQAVSLGLESKFFNKKLTNNLIAKYFNYSSKGIDIPKDPDKIVTKNDSKQTNGSSFGFAEAIKYDFYNNNSLRMSVEFSNRLPDQMELFGDVSLIVSNFSLIPEKSSNISLGYQYKKDNISLELNSFYRYTKNLILLEEYSEMFRQYQNINQSEGFGLEGDFSIKLLKSLDLSFNFTWQDIRQKKFKNKIDEWKNDTRVPNVPYFFYNITLNKSFKNLLTNSDEIRLYAYYNFIKEFHNQTISKSLENNHLLGLFGQSKLKDRGYIIPSQHLFSLGFTYFINKNISASFETKNILNKKLYDFYNIQKAGRSFHLKINYNIN